MRSLILLRLQRCYEPIAEEERKASLISRFVYRPVSFYLTIPFVWMNSSANAVTALRIPAATIASLLIAIGPWPLLLAGSILHAIGTLLDYADGNLARLQQSDNVFGELLDGSVHIFERCVFPIAIAVGLCLRPDQLCKAYGVSARLTLSAGFLISMLGFSRTALSVLQFVTNQLRIHVPAQIRPGPATQVLVSLRETTDSSLRTKIKYIVRRLLTEGALLLDAIGVIIFATFDLMSVFLIAVGIQNVFRLRDESQMVLDMLRNHSKKPGCVQSEGDEVRTHSV